MVFLLLAMPWDFPEFDKDRPFKDDWERGTASYAPPTTYEMFQAMHRSGVLGPLLMDLGCGPKPISGCVNFPPIEPSFNYKIFFHDELNTSIGTIAQHPKILRTYSLHRLLIDYEPNVHMLSEPDSPTIMQLDLRHIDHLVLEEGIQQAYSAAQTSHISSILASAIVNYIWPERHEVFGLLDTELASGGLVIVQNHLGHARGVDESRRPKSNEEIMSFFSRDMGYRRVFLQGFTDLEYMHMVLQKP
jgi:hypothetical protein